MTCTSSVSQRKATVQQVHYRGRVLKDIGSYMFWVRASHRILKSSDSSPVLFSGELDFLMFPKVSDAAYFMFFVTPNSLEKIIKSEYVLKA